MIYIGIDPGTSGALAMISESRAAKVIPWSPEAYRDALAGVSLANEYAVACLEKVGAMPGQGVTGMFNFGKNYGHIIGLLEANGIPYELVHPRKWQKEFSVTDKNSSLEICKRLFPLISLKRNKKCKKDDNGMSDALLMAEYARRHL